MHGLIHLLLTLSHIDRTAFVFEGKNPACFLLRTTWHPYPVAFIQIPIVQDTGHHDSPNPDGQNFCLFARWEMGQARIITYFIAYFHSRPSFIAKTADNITGKGSVRFSYSEHRAPTSRTACASCTNNNEHQPSLQFLSLARIDAASVNLHL
jgi:hypothetical protein